MKAKSKFQHKINDLILILSVNFTVISDFSFYNNLSNHVLAIVILSLLINHFYMAGNYDRWNWRVSGQLTLF